MYDSYSLMWKSFEDLFMVVLYLVYIGWKKMIN